MARRYYSSIAARTTLTADINSTTTTMAVAAVTGWPTSFPYTILIDHDTVNEEIVEVTARSGTTLTIVRGVDGSTAVAHTAGALVKNGISARDVSEPNEHVNTTTGTAHGLVLADVVTVGGTQTLTNKTISQSQITNLTADLAAKADLSLTINAQTGTSYTLVLADAGKLVTLANAAAVTLTIPLNSSVAFPVGTQIGVMQTGAGQVTLSPASGVTLNSYNSAKKLIGNNGLAVLVKVGTDTWQAAGGLVT